MDANLSAPIGAQTFTGQFWGRRLVAALTRLWAAYLKWRIERQAIAHLRTMSDAQLKDIGLERSQIEHAVLLGMDPPQARPLRPLPCTTE
jgi:uncharacterized protein YjiS (DUF1127 family)